MAAGVTIAARDGAGRLIGGSALTNFTGGVVNTAANPAVLVAAQGTGTIIRVYKLFLGFGPAGTFPNVVTFQDAVTTTLSGPIPIAASGASLVLDMDGQPWFECTANQAFQLVNPGTLQVSGVVWYTATQFI